MARLDTAEQEATLAQNDRVLRDLEKAVRAALRSQREFDEQAERASLFDNPAPAA